MSAVATYRVLVGDALEQLRTLPDASVQCVVTSPPYFGLRDYGVEGQIGLESTPEAYIQRLVEVFREVWRVLREDGTAWVVMGDSYANDEKWGGSTGGKHTKTLHGQPVGRGKRQTGLKPKDLVGIPWRVAFALQADGWYLRSEIIWDKSGNCMPESVKDRPTRAHETIFLLAQREQYYYDIDSIREPHTDLASVLRHKDVGRGRQGYAQSSGLSDHPQRDSNGGLGGHALGRNSRDVWHINTAPSTHVAHFATFPEALVEPMILAGCPVGGTVLDPFAGSGTTLAVANQLGRHAIGIELNPKYVALIHERCQQPSWIFEEGSR